MNETVVQFKTQQHLSSHQSWNQWKGIIGRMSASTLRTTRFWFRSINSRNQMKFIYIFMLSTHLYLHSIFLINNTTKKCLNFCLFLILELKDLEESHKQSPKSSGCPPFSCIARHRWLVESCLYIWLPIVVFFRKIN